MADLPDIEQFASSNSAGLPQGDLNVSTNKAGAKFNTSNSGFNRITGFIEVYKAGTKFENSKPFSPLSNNLLYSSGEEFVERANGATNDPLATVRFLNSVSIKSSFRTLTDTCEVVIPRVDHWIINDSRYINNASIVDPNLFKDTDFFSQGNIVRVYLGYDFQDKLMFQGYITEVVAKSPITLKLEDAMWLLKRKVISKTYLPAEGQTEIRLSDFIYDIIDGTGVELDQSTKDIAEDITFGAYFRAKQSSVARIMADIQDRGLSVFVEDGKLVIGRTYFDSTLTPHVSTKSAPNYVPPKINFEWNVPKGGNKLVVSSPEKKRKMVTVTAFLGARTTRQLQLNVALDPNSSDDVFIGAQIHDSANKGDTEKELALNNWLRDKYKIAVDTDGYSQNTATMPIIHVDNKKMTSDDSEFEDVVDKMFEYGKDKFTQFFDNGLGGSITVFGDYGLKSAQSVQLFDPRNPEISSESLITEVATDWGFGGYRQTLKVGIKIKDIDLTSSNILENED